MEMMEIYTKISSLNNKKDHKELANKDFIKK